MNHNYPKTPDYSIRLSSFRSLFLVLFAFGLLTGCADDDDTLMGDDVPQFPLLDVPDGFSVEKVAEGLHLPTGMAWDDDNNMYIVEAGAGLFPEQLAPMRLMRVEDDGSTTEIANLSDAGLMPSIVGMTWHDGWFYVTHRAQDLTGAVSRVSMDGQVELVFSGILDSKSEHQINDIRVGPDGMMYVAVGLAGNAGVMGPSVAPFVMKSPDAHPRPCEDIVLTGRNFKTPDFRTETDSDTVMTGAYVPFGETTQPGQVIKGVTLCGGSILKFDPNNAMSTMETHAWGFRNLIGLAWDNDGNMYAAENGYDVRGSRPVNDEVDVSLRVNEGQWYGVPDFSAGREPLTMDKFESPDSLQAPVFVNGEFVGKDLGFVIDHEASGLDVPDPSLVVARHEFNSSPSMIDAAPADWGDFSGQLFVAEWGDLAPPTNPLRGKDPAGSQIVRIDPNTGTLTTFLANVGGKRASDENKIGQGLDRPFTVRFGPDEAMYIVDYGVTTIDPSQKPPYAYRENSGVIWKVTRD